MIGNNDVLGYATAGGAGVNQTGNLNPATYGGSDISDPNVVVGSIQAIVQTLTQGGAKGAIANVPNVLGAPYFTTVPHNPIPLDAATATMLNSAAAYGAYNAGIAQLASLGIISAAEKTKRTITFAAGAGNAVVILDESLTDLSGFNPALTKMRQATAADKVVLTAQNVIGKLVNNNPSLINGVSVPLEDKWVLTPQEQAEISTATQAINAGIAQVAQAYGLPLVDTYGFFNGLIANGVTLADGSKITAKYGSGGGFSLDGVHPTPRGYALISNLFINAINSTYKSNLPAVNPLDYKGLYVN
jgi:phospholipase/lecithinase/hemolysin